jgi:DNA-binding XRE family transcriptional regulator
MVKPYVVSPTPDRACQMMFFTSLELYEISLILPHIWTDRVITSFQMRAARALLGIDQKTLAELAGVSLPTIQRMEASAGNVRGVVESLTRVVEALDRAGVALIGEGARSDEGGRGVRLKEQGPPRRI